MILRLDNKEIYILQILTDELLEFTKTLKVLYVEDNKAAQEAVGELLGLFFSDIVTAVDGVDGLEKFKKDKFDMVVSDIKMPRMNGIEMAKIIRESSSTVAIIMVTAHQESEYLLECIRCSVDGYLLKPIDIQQLEETISKVVNKLYCDRAIQDYEQHLQEQVKQRTKELEVAHEELISIANKDPMTELYNRRYFNEISNTLLQISKREKNALSALMIDIDRFKVVNDSYGHLVGDEVLKRVAKILLEMIRESDIAVRFGGEEFIILLPGTELSGAAVIAQKMRKSIELAEIVLDDNSVVKFTVSIGIATCDCYNDIDIDDLVHHVDVAMYDAKRSGRNKVVLYNKEIF